MSGPMMLPGGPLEICFSFDTTLSMTTYVDQVKARLQDMVQRLKSDIPGIRIALFAHGDYYQPKYDNKCPYVTRHIDFTDDVSNLCTFIQQAVPTDGGDWDECYELVMKEAREKLSWSAGTNKVLVMIGDATPHKVNDYGVRFEGEKIDWKEEAEKLLQAHIRSYGVYCNTPYSGDKDKNFYKSLSDIGKGSFLELKSFDSIFDFMMAICYREHGEDALVAYEAEIKGRSGGAAKDVRHMLTTLKKSVSNASMQGTSTAASTSASKTKAQKNKPTAIAKVTKATGASVKAKVVGKQTPKAKGRPTSKQAKTRSSNARTTNQKQAGTTNQKRVRTTNQVGQKRIGQYKSRTTPQKKPLPRLRREKVPETNFALRYYPWSSWKVVLSSEAGKHLIPTTEQVGKKTKVVGYSRVDIFKGKTQCPALYEFAVKPKGCCRKKIVYAKISPGFSSQTRSTEWWNVLFPSKSLMKQVDNIVRKQGGDILVRRLIIKKYRSYDSIPSVVKNYDYVWAPEHGVKKYRELKHGSYVISEDMEIK